MAARKDGSANRQVDVPRVPAADAGDRHWTERVRARARELGLTDAEVARRLHLSPTRYANYMGRSREPDLMLFTRMCRSLDTTPDRILAFEADPQPDSPGGRVLARATSTLRALPPASLPLAHALLAALAMDAGQHPAAPSKAGVGVPKPGGKPRARKSGSPPKA